MVYNLIPRSFFDFSSRLPALFSRDVRDIDEWPSEIDSSGGLSISEDDKHVVVEAAVPGVDPENIEVTYAKGILWIRANSEQKEEDKKRKYYRQATRSFSYRLAVPGQIDPTPEPTVTCKHGIIKVIFEKTPEEQPKRLPIKTEV